MVHGRASHHAVEGQVGKDVTNEDPERYARETKQWQGPKLFVLLAGTLAVALTTLWLLAAWSQQHFAP